VLLVFCNGGKPFLARRALFSGFLFPVSSETGNFVSVGYFHAVPVDQVSYSHVGGNFVRIPFIKNNSKLALILWQAYLNSYMQPP
jgi:hypothetical protein